MYGDDHLELSLKGIGGSRVKFLFSFTFKAIVGGVKVTLGVKNDFKLYYGA